MLRILQDEEEEAAAVDKNTFAERHGEFIFDMMTLYGSRSTPIYIQRDVLRRFEDVPAGYGLFVLFVEQVDNTVQKLPVYVGRTKRSFLERLRQMDVIGDVLTNLQDGHRLGVYVSKLSHPVACFLKHFLLEAFNFSLNSSVNIPRRPTLEYESQYLRKESAETISTKWRESLGELKTLDTKLQVMKYESPQEIRDLRQENETLRKDIDDLKEQIKHFNPRLDDN